MRPDSISVSFTQKNETGLGLGIVHSKITRPDSVSVLFTLKNKTRQGIGIVQFQKARPDSVSVSFNFKKQDQTRYLYCYKSTKTHKF